MNLHVICNPLSGNGAGKTIMQRAARLLSERHVTATFHETARPLHAVELTRAAIDAGADAVAAIGGDGTIQEVAQSLVGTDIPLGLIPAGTGNDYVKTIRVPVETDAAVALILNGTPRAVDTVRINDRLFLNECGCGFDVMVLDYAEKAKKIVKGILPYLHGVLQTIWHFKDIRLTLSIDGVPAETRDILVLAVGNGRYIGGGIPIAPRAVPDDGKLDVLVVNGMTRWRMLCALPGLLQGKIESFPETTHRYAQKLHVEGTGLRINIDGEIVTMDQADIMIQPSSLLVYRP